MTEPNPKCFQCKNEIPVGKYFELHRKQLDTFYKMGDYCSPCWDKEKTRYELEIKNEMLKVIEAERERERERAKSGQPLSEMPKEFNRSWINRGGKNQSTL